MSGVTLRNIVKSYGEVRVLHGIDLEIADNEFAVFVGPSGCGKSTLLRLIAGLEDIDEGAVSIGSRDVTDLEPVDRGIAMVFQSYALYPHMTVEENMSFGLKVTGEPPAEIKQRVSEAARSLQLEDYLSRKPSQLSGGQRQRVAIGRAIVRKPEVFLLDEPLSNLDAELRNHMRIEIARLHNRLGSTMIYVTHDQIEAMTLADKIVVLQDGRIEQVGTPLELFDNPDNMFVAGFIGSPKMNFLHGRISSIENGRALFTFDKGTGSELALPLSSAAGAPGQDVVMGIRPEHLGIDSGSAEIMATADVTEQMGDTGHLHAYLSDGAPVVGEIRGRRWPMAGEQIKLSFDPARAFLFDTAGHRLR